MMTEITCESLLSTVSGYCITGNVFGPRQLAKLVLM